ncbi:MAG: LamG domain-containing protein [Candidatus Micrarchaeia archaeon]
MYNRGQGSFEYVLMIAGVVLVLTVIVVVLQNQATGSSQALEQNVEHHELVACDSNKEIERGNFLVFSWHFNEKSGTVAKDSSSNGYDGTLVSIGSKPKWVIGKVRNGLEFSGNDQQLVRMNLPGSPLSSQELTGCAWFKVDAVEDSGAPVRDGILMAGFSFLELWVNSDGTFRYGAQTTNLYEIQSFSPNSYPFGQWTHACVVNKGSGSSTLYINGNLDDSIPLTGNLLDVSWFEVGRQGSFDGNYFDGVIDEVRFYSKALSAQEVLADMNCGHLA